MGEGELGNKEGLQQQQKNKFCPMEREGRDGAKTRMRESVESRYKIKCKYIILAGEESETQRWIEDHLTRHIAAYQRGVVDIYQTEREPEDVSERSLRLFSSKTPVRNIKIIPMSVFLL